MCKFIRILCAILVLALLLCACSKTKPTLEATTPTPIVIVVTATSPPDTPKPPTEPTPSPTPTSEPTPSPASTDTPIPLATITPTPAPTIVLPTMNVIVTDLVILSPTPTAQFTPGELIDTFELDDSVFDRMTPTLILDVSDYEILGTQNSIKLLGYIVSATEEKIYVDEVNWIDDSESDGGFRIANDSSDISTFYFDPSCEVWFIAGSYPHYRVPIADLPPYVESWGDEVIWDIYIEDGDVVMLVEKYMP